MSKHPANSLSESLKNHKRWLALRYSPNPQDFTKELQPKSTFQPYPKETRDFRPLKTFTLETEESSVQEAGLIDIRSLNFSTLRKYDTTQGGTEGGSRLGNDNKQKRWEMLYNLSKKNLEIREQLVRQTMDEDLGPECTFQPKLNSTFDFSRIKNVEPLHERSLIWKEQRESRLNQIRELNRDNDLRGCSFQPNIGKEERRSRSQIPVTTVTPFGYDGIEDHMYRQLIARKAREENNLLHKSTISRSPEKARKKGEVLVGKEPKLQTAERALRVKKMENERLNETISEEKIRKMKRNDSSFMGMKKRSQKEFFGSIHNYESFGAREPASKFAKACQELHKELYKFSINYD